MFEPIKDGQIQTSLSCGECDLPYFLLLRKRNGAEEVFGYALMLKNSNTLLHSVFFFPWPFIIICY